MANAKTKTLEAPKRAYYRLRLVGTAPLLYHRRGDIMKATHAAVKLGLPKPPREKWDAVAELRDCLDVVGDRSKMVVIDGKGRTVDAYEGPWENPIDVFAAMKSAGHFVLPANGVKACLVRACKLAGFAMTDAQTSLAVRAAWLPIEGDDPRMRCDLVRLPNGGPDLRIRAEFASWAVWVPIVVRCGVWSTEKLVATFSDAGQFVGLHDWRTECGGQFGSFEVESIMEMKKGDADSFASPKKKARGAA